MSELRTPVTKIGSNPMAPKQLLKFHFLCHSGVSASITGTEISGIYQGNSNTRRIAYRRISKKGKMSIVNETLKEGLWKRVMVRTCQIFTSSKSRKVINQIKVIVSGILDPVRPRKRKVQNS